MNYQNKKIVLCYNDKESKEFRRIEDILNIIKMKYGVDIEYNKIKENKLFILIGNKKFNVNYKLDYYMRVVESIK